MSYADCGGSDWTEISASEVNKDEELDTNITSHLTLAKRVLDDIIGRVVTLKKSVNMMHDDRATCDAAIAVSRNWQLVM